MAHFTAEMGEVVDFLIAEKVLVDAQMDTSEYRRFACGEACRRTVFVGCPDCDELKDKMVFHGTVLGEKFHPIAPVHGGASAFHPASLMMPHGAPRIPYDYFLYEIARSAEIKNTRKVSFYSHAPCSAAGAAGFSIPQLIEMQLYNRGLLDFSLSRFHSPMEVLPYFHVDFQETRTAGKAGQTPNSGKKDKKTFLVSRAAWLDVREQFWTEHLVRLPHRLTELIAA
ncbi:MAG: hypothetical protein ACM3NH_02190 [Candidatus Saccharibacteria bacterium]